jgi:diguanylate cyclase (GGDEF)-like protein
VAAGEEAEQIQNMMLGTDQTRYADDRYAEQRKAGFTWLRFTAELEEEFRASYIAANANRIRAASLIGLAAVFGFIGLDQFVGMNLQDQRSDILLMVVTVPGILVPLAVTFRPSAGRYLLPVLFGGVLLVALSILVVIVIGRTNQPWFPWESLIVVTMYVFFVAGLMFYQAMLCNGILWAAFVVTNWTLQSHEVLLYEAYYLLVANVVGWLGVYMLERQMRLAFLLQHELRQQAVLDSLTGLMNRRAFTSHLETAWLQAQRGLTSVGLILLDLDGFKRINDTCGHQFGDNALYHVATVLRASALRPLDAAGRYGGDEFIAVWFDVDGNWFAKLAQELPLRFEGLQCGDPKAPLKVTVSGGAVLAWPRPGLALRDAVKAADEKLYEMKRGHRGTIGFLVLRPPPPTQQTAA